MGNEAWFNRRQKKRPRHGKRGQEGQTGLFALRFLLFLAADDVFRQRFIDALLFPKNGDFAFDGRSLENQKNVGLGDGDGG